VLFARFYSLGYKGQGKGCFWLRYGCNIGSSSPLFNVVLLGEVISKGLDLSDVLRL
jgi:hypothetical protein